MNVEVSFRFLSLNKLQAHTLEREVANSSARYVEDKNCYVGTIPLTEDIFDPLMIFFERQQIALSNCDIFLSVLSSKDTNIVDVPSSVNKMLKHINCKLVFSYTAVSNDL
tara:strand:+ start:165 stop:494 length:330 start_codon:yes stop_codon:yes gene_type:complete